MNKGDERAASGMFTKRPVVLMKDGEVVERYGSLAEFHEAWAENSVDMTTTQKRVAKRLDGWLPDGMVARYEDEKGAEGRELAKHMARQTLDGSPKAKMQREMSETSEKIEAAYEAWRRGEMTTEERNAEVVWLENHVKVLRERIKNYGKGGGE